MTNEEIRQKAQALYDNIGPDFGEQIEVAMRALVLQAYAEAVTLAETYDLTVASQSYDQRSAACIAAEQIATRIRAVREQLQPQFVA